MGILEGFAVSGEYVNNLNDKSFVILKVPVYEERPDPDNEGEKKRKLKLFIELSDGAHMDYYPNKTSQKEMGNAWGVNLDNWLSKRAEFKVMNQMVKKEEMKVLYVKVTPVKIEKIK